MSADVGGVRAQVTEPDSGEVRDGEEVSDFGVAAEDFEIPSEVDMGDEVVTYPNQPMGNPLNPAYAAYPYPSNFFLKPDENSLTEYRLELPDEVLPELFNRDPMRGMDGFSRMPLIIAHFSGGVNVSDLPSPIAHQESVADQSLTWLIEASTLARVGHLAEIDALSPQLEDAPLIIRPLTLLKANTEYVVIIKRGLKNVDGELHEPNSAFTALRDGRPTDMLEIERQRLDFERINRVIDGLNLTRSDVLLAWNFHTRSEAALVEPLLSMQRIASEIALPPYEITKDELIPPNRQIEGTFDAPNFITPQGVSRNAQGEVEPQGIIAVPFTLTIPMSVNDSGEPRPVIMYGHGFLGQRDQATRGSFNELCQR